MSLSVENVRLTYGPGSVFATEALKGVSFSLRAGEIVGLVGRTGSGKSSLLQVLAGLEPVDHGSVVLEGMSLYRKETDRQKLRRLVGISFQYPEHQFFAETITKELSFGLQQQSLSNEEIDERIADSLRLVHLEQIKRERSPFELSGGQMRRLALATVFAMRPRYLLLDEPVAGLDPQSRSEILSCLSAYRQRHQAAVFFVSHSMEDIARIAERIVVLDRGKVLFDASPKELFMQEELLLRAGLELPGVYTLLRELRALGIDIPAEPVWDLETASRALEHYLQRAARR